MPTAILKVPSHLYGRRVLVVADESLPARDMERTLLVAGVRVLGPAASARSAFALLDAERPDAAILDLDPRDGMAAPIAMRLTEMKVPFILSTDHCEMPAGAKGLFSSIPTITKPAVPGHCLKLLGEVLA